MLVSIVMGSDSDLATMRGAADVLDGYKIAWEIRILSAHRAPIEVARYASEAADRGIAVIIAGAGMAAHLAGVVAAHTPLPVIGVPLLSTSSGLAGADALYSTVQMPPGVPVATVGVGAAKNAGHLAARMIGASDADVRARVESAMSAQTKDVLAKDEGLRTLGIQSYLRAREQQHG